MGTVHQGCMCAQKWLEGYMGEGEDEMRRMRMKMTLVATGNLY